MNNIEWTETAVYVGGFKRLIPNVAVGDTVNLNGKIGQVTSIWNSGTVTCKGKDGFFNINPIQKF